MVSLGNSQVFAILYGYTYGLVVIAMMITSYFLASQLELFYIFYDMIDEITRKAEEMSVVYVHVFDRPIKMLNAPDLRYNRKRLKEFNNYVFDSIIGIVEKYRKDMQRQIDRQFDKQKQDMQNIQIARENKKKNKNDQKQLIRSGSKPIDSHNYDETSQPVTPSYGAKNVWKKNDTNDNNNDNNDNNNNNNNRNSSIAPIKLTSMSPLHMLSVEEIQDQDQDLAIKDNKEDMNMDEKKQENDHEIKIIDMEIEKALIEIVGFPGPTSTRSIGLSAVSNAFSRNINQSPGHGDTSQTDGVELSDRDESDQTDNENDHPATADNSNDGYYWQTIKRHRLSKLSMHKMERMVDKVNDFRDSRQVKMENDTRSRPSQRTKRRRRNNSNNNIQRHSTAWIKSVRFWVSVCNFISSFIAILWNLRNLMLIVVSHFFDTATDIGLVYEWGSLYYTKLDTDPEYLKGVDIGTLFWCCLGVIIYYRIGSSFQVYRLNHSLSDAIWQFLFDFFLIKLIYINLVKMHSYKPLEMIKIMRGIEGSHESAYQAILSLVFLIQTHFKPLDNDNNNYNAYITSATLIPIVSFVFSTWSLISRFTAFDYHYLQQDARKCSLNGKKLCHQLFRSIEVTFSIILFSLFWTQVGEIGVFGLVIISLYVPYNTFKNKGYISTEFLKTLLISDIATPTIWNNLQKTPYGYIKNPFEKWFKLFLHFEGLTLFRLIICILIALPRNIRNYFSIQQAGDVDSIVYVLINVQFLLVLILFVYKWIISMYFVKNNAWELRDREGELAFNPLNFVSRKKFDEILFCKYLGVVSVFEVSKKKRQQRQQKQVKKDPANKCSCRRNRVCQTLKRYVPKSRKKTEIADNMLEALVLADDLYYYDVVESWYNKLGLEAKYGETFVQYLKNIGFNSKRIMKQCRKFCYSADSFILLHSKLELVNFTKFKDKKQYDNNLLHTMCYRARLKVVEWIINDEIIKDINALDARNDTALHCAILGILNLKKREFTQCTLEEKKIIRMLIDKNIDESIKAQDSYDKEKWMTAREMVIDRLGAPTLYDQLVDRQMVYKD